MNKEFDNIKLEMTIEKYLEKMERKLERILWKAKNEDTKKKNLVKELKSSMKK